MGENEKPTDFRRDSNAAQPMRLNVIFGAVLVVLLAVAIAFKFRNNTPAVQKPAPAPVVAVSQSKGPALPPVPHLVSLPAAKPAPVPQAAPPPPPVAPEKLSVQELVAELTNIGANGHVTPEQAARFKQDLQELIQRGAVSVSAIQEFLQKNTDISYKDVAGGDQLGFATLRTSFIDALKQIGGPEADTAMLATLQTTAAPSELLQLATALNQDAPGQYRAQVMDAVQATLKLAAAGQLGTNVELAPLLRLSQTYGTGSSISDASKNDPGQFYNAVQLANMPNGQGLPSLVQMAQNSSGGSQLMATEMIAQMAGQNSDALNTLAQMVEDGKIPPSDWVHIAPLLGGDQYQIDPSGQSYSVVAGATTPDQINQRIWLIDTFMTYVPDGSGAYKALTQERTVLSAKLGAN